MRRIHQKGLQNTTWPVDIICIIFGVILFLPSSSGQVNNQNPLIREGEYPPDFDLPRLHFKTDESGKTVGVIDEKDTVRLSSFRGKKPVCLIMSSYT
jgi:hypothetical protein